MKPKKPGQKKLRVFIVENHPDTVFGLRMYLDVLGHEAHVAHDMKTALKMAREIEFDVLLSDISLPDGDGWELMRRLSAERPITGIAMSGYGMQSDIAKSKAAGFIKHLIKPMLPEELERALTAAAARGESSETKPRKARRATKIMRNKSARSRIKQTRSHG